MKNIGKSIVKCEKFPSPGRCRQQAEGPAKSGRKAAGRRGAFLLAFCLVICGILTGWAAGFPAYGQTVQGTVSGIAPGILSEIIPGIALEREEVRQPSVRPGPVLLAKSDADADGTEAFQAASRRVFDQAGIWSAEEISGMESRIQKLQDQMKMDVVLVTTVDAQGKSSQDYADDFYDQGGFGTRKDHSGVLYLIDLDNRELYISTSGTMIRFLTDSRIEETLDHAYEYAVNGDYRGVAESFLADTESWYRKGIPGGQYNYDTETGKISRYRHISLLEAVIALAVAGCSAAFVCMRVKKEYAMEETRSQASNFLMAYRADCQFALHGQQDNLVNSFTRQAIIPRNQGVVRPGGSSFGGGSVSSTHHSSGGHTHGGGGRRF